MKIRNWHLAEHEAHMINKDLPPARLLFLHITRRDPAACRKRDRRVPRFRLTIDNWKESDDAATTETTDGIPQVVRTVNDHVRSYLKQQSHHFLSVYDQFLSVENRLEIMFQIDGTSYI